MPEHPTPPMIRNAREAAGMSREDAAALVHRTHRAWQEWELGNRNMPVGLWELFQLKVDKTNDDRTADATPA